MKEPQAAPSRVGDPRSGGGTESGYVPLAAPLDLEPRGDPSAAADKMLPGLAGGGDAAVPRRGGRPRGPGPNPPRAELRRRRACRGQRFRKPLPGAGCNRPPRAPTAGAAAARRGWGAAGRRYLLPPPGRAPPAASARPRGGARGSDFSRRRSGAAGHGGAEHGSGGGAVPAGGGAGGRAAVPGPARRGGRSLLHCGPAAAAAAAAPRHEALPVVAVQGGQATHQG